MRTQNFEVKELYLFLCQHIIIFSWQSSHKPLLGEGVPACVTVGSEVLFLCSITANQGTSLAKAYFDVRETGTEISITSSPCTEESVVLGRAGGYGLGWVDCEAKTGVRSMGTQSRRCREILEPAHKNTCFLPSTAHRMLACVSSLHSKTSSSRQQKGVRKSSVNSIHTDCHGLLL